MHRFSLVAVIDRRGWLLMQERDANARIGPDKWSLPGGGLEPGEDHLAAALREVAEETGLRLATDDLSSLGVVGFFSEECQDIDEFGLFVVRTEATQDEVRCGEGRQMVFVPPDRWRERDLVEAVEVALPIVEDHLASRSPARRFAGVILVDQRGRLLLQERDEHPVIDPEKWGLPGGHVEDGESFAEAARRELAEETGVELAQGELTLWIELWVDHRESYGTFDQMQVYAASTRLEDQQIDCREGRQIVFVEPQAARQLPLSAAGAVIVPAFLSSPLYANMAP